VTKLQEELQREEEEYEREEAELQRLDELGNLLKGLTTVRERLNLWTKDIFDFPLCRMMVIFDTEFVIFLSIRK
jgi:hypothetical protein